ncbi:hypothetical protein PCANC_02658 [Puccinia coronata f. sp. avenae]|uniref:Uncharacterized protein n=1 Tax=Puccinia coronata f. sp. avenae TaxID=200324 RepID=A0A2N5W5G0_9BASI|nr:hypothetical protein PCANC_02658 [Puccinia coronata f. sp. avenae]
MGISARPLNSRRVLIIPSQHQSSTLSRQAIVLQISSPSEQLLELAQSSPIHTEISSQPCLSGSCNVGNQSHSFNTQLLSRRNYDSDSPELSFSTPSHDGAAIKTRKTHKHKKTRKTRVVKKPLHTAYKGIAHKHIHSIAHHSDHQHKHVQQPLSSAAINHSSATQVTTNPTVPVDAGVTLSTPQTDEQKPASPKASTPQSTTLATAQDSTAESTTSPNVGASALQSSQPEAVTKQTTNDSSAQESTPKATSPPPSQDSTSPKTALSPVQPSEAPAAEVKSPSSQGSTPASAASTAASPNNGNAPVSATAVGSNGNVNISLPQQASSPSLLPLTNASTSLHNATTSTNGTLSGVKTNFNGLTSGSTLSNVSKASPSTNHTGAALGGLFGILAFFALAASVAIIISRRCRARKGTKGSAEPTHGAGNNQSTMSEVLSGNRVMTLNTSSNGFSETSDGPIMSPVDPVTRFSLGGFGLLKQLETITENLNRSPKVASPGGGSSDGEPTERMADTPTSAEYPRRPFSISQLKTDMKVDAAESPSVSPLLFRSDSDDSVGTPIGFGGTLSQSQILDHAHRASAGTDASSVTGVTTTSSGYIETVRFEDSGDVSHGNSTKADSEQAWWGTGQAVTK